MANITPTLFRTRLKEFNNETVYSDDYINMFIAETLCEMSECAWGCFFQKGQIFLTAHYIAMADLTSQGGQEGAGSSGGQTSFGPLASESEGDTSVSYRANSANGIFSGAGNDELLASTTYGQQYLESRSKAIIGGTATGTPPFPCQGSGSGDTPEPPPVGPVAATWVDGNWTSIVGNITEMSDPAGNGGETGYSLARTNQIVSLGAGFTGVYFTLDKSTMNTGAPVVLGFTEEFTPAQAAVPPVGGPPVTDVIGLNLVYDPLSDTMVFALGDFVAGVVDNIMVSPFDDSKTFCLASNGVGLLRLYDMDADPTTPLREFDSLKADTSNLTQFGYLIINPAPAPNWPTIVARFTLVTEPTIEATGVTILQDP